jgi:hypothetical protein
MSAGGAALARPGWLVWGLVTVTLPLVCLVAPERYAAARGGALSPRNPSAVMTRTRSLQTYGAAALSRGDHAEATSALESAYRQAPSAQGLLWLGRLAQAQGQRLAAHDFARRYLAALGLAEEGADAAMGPDGGSPRVRAPQADVQDAVAMLQAPVGAFAELRVLGPLATLVWVDGRLVGELPLTRPLRVTPGKHEIGMEADGRRLTAHAEVAAGRLIELRADAATGVAVVTPVRRLAVYLEADSAEGEPPQLPRTLYSALHRVSRREHLALWVLRDSSPTSCSFTEPECLDQLAQHHEVEYVLKWRRSGPQASAPHLAEQGSWRGQLSLFSTETGSLAAMGELSCEACSPERAAAALEQEVTSLMTAARLRPRGTLQIESRPEGSVVLSAGRPIGVTPYRRVAWAELHQLELRHPGYQSTRLELAVSPGQTASASAVLLPAVAAPEKSLAPATPGVILPPRPLVERPPRPRWQLAVGGSMLALGAGLVGLGISAWSVDGSCSADTPATALGCRSTYVTQPYGLALLSAGASAVIVGGTLLLVPSLSRASGRLQMRSSPHRNQNSADLAGAAL